MIKGLAKMFTSKNYIFQISNISIKSHATPKYSYCFFDEILASSEFKITHFISCKNICLTDKYFGYVK